MAIALSTLLAISVTLSADPGGLTLGKDASARIQVRVTGLFGRSLPAARVSLSTNVGAVGEPQPGGDGVFTAAFTPPRSRAPAVALIAADAEVEGDHALGWLALPLAGSDSMTLETKPHASVHLRIADREFGPAVANAKGEVQMQVVVPPGVDKATMHVEDALGNTADRQFDLDPPPFTRMRVLPVGPAQAAAGESLELQAFLVRRDGSPDPDARVIASADRGGVDVSRNRRGVVAVSWQAPRGGAGQTAIEVEGLGEHAEVRASVAPGAARTRGPWLAGLGRPSAGLLGSAGTTFSGVPAFGAIAELALPLTGTPLEALLDVGGLAWLATTEPAPSPFLGRPERATATGFFAQLGARGTRTFSVVDLHAALLLGVQQTWVSAGSPGAPSLSRSASELGVRAGAALGASWPIGPGRMLVQVQANLTPALGGLENPLSGFALQAGYLLTLGR
ncbi:MAG TPA: hypothetical protein VKC58_13050 [Myxococcales bacterium]|nr:hypothetical protein [Myxococcales bacterium]